MAITDFQALYAATRKRQLQGAFGKKIDARESSTTHMVELHGSRSPIIENGIQYAQNTFAHFRKTKRSQKSDNHTKLKKMPYIAPNNNPVKTSVIEVDVIVELVGKGIAHEILPC